MLEWFDKWLCRWVASIAGELIVGDGDRSAEIIANIGRLRTRTTMSAGQPKSQVESWVESKRNTRGCAAALILVTSVPTWRSDILVLHRTSVSSESSCYILGQVSKAMSHDRM